MAVDEGEFPIFSERFVDDLRDGPIAPGGMSFDMVVSAIKSRGFRKEILHRAARILAERLADYIADSEGWHGERRREIIQNQRGNTA